MLTMCLFFLVLGGLLAFSLLLTAWLVRLGAKWARIDGVSLKRAVLVALLIELAYLAARFLLIAIFGRPSGTGAERLLDTESVAELVLGPLAACALVQWALHTTLRKAILVWLPTLLATAATLVMAFAVVRPLLFEAFVVPTNAMAPTIVGRHLQAICPSCGGTAYASPPVVRVEVPVKELGICGNCMRASSVSVTSDRVVQGDRLIAAKFLQPQRWDLVVFRNPEDPSITYVSRLVGLPGDEVAVHDGDLWINGTRAQRPASISSLEYVAHPAETEKTVWGPVKLGSREYVVLSDFSRRAKDSRFWASGAPGHPPYAVPESYISGVVTQIYWPPSRWRTFR
jgi:signal peptidase I